MRQALIANGYTASPTVGKTAIDRDAQGRCGPVSPGPAKPLLLGYLCAATASLLKCKSCPGFAPPPISFDHRPRISINCIDHRRRRHKKTPIPTVARERAPSTSLSATLASKSPNSRRQSKSRRRLVTALIAPTPKAPQARRDRIPIVLLRRPLRAIRLRGGL
jgi:hypothetical protein